MRVRVRVRVRGRGSFGVGHPLYPLCQTDVHP